MEALQFSQILADLSTLQSTVRPPLSRSTSCPPPPTPNTGPSSLLTTSSHASSSQEPSAAAKLLNANNQLSQSHLRKKSKGSILPEPPRFDKLGRRIIRGPVSGTASPKMMPAPLSRMSSSFSALSSGTTTPNKDGGGEPVSTSSPYFSWEMFEANFNITARRRHGPRKETPRTLPDAW